MAMLLADIKLKELGAVVSLVVPYEFIFDFNFDGQRWEEFLISVNNKRSLV